MSQTKKSNVSYLFLLIALVIGSIIIIVRMKPWESKRDSDLSHSNELGDFELFQKFTTLKTTTVICRHLTKTSDGKCHDQANFPVCMYDGGDCCFPEIDDSECETCYCHMDNRRHPSSLEIDGKSRNPFRKKKLASLVLFLELENCDGEYRPMVGDGECDDLTNTYDCKHDQGDCCLEYIDDTYCITCICHETGLKHPLKSNISAAA